MPYLRIDSNPPMPIFSHHLTLNSYLPHPKSFIKIIKVNNLSLKVNMPTSLLFKISMNLSSCWSFYLYSYGKKKKKKLKFQSFPITVLEEISLYSIFICLLFEVSWLRKYATEIGVRMRIPLSYHSKKLFWPCLHEAYDCRTTSKLPLNFL